ncbi:hypothetical protein Tco_1338054 [Tanacetum coccineum]
MVTMEIWCREDGVDVVVRMVVKMMMTTMLWWWRGDVDEPVGGDDVDGVRMVMVVSMGSMCKDWQRGGVVCSVVMRCMEMRKGAAKHGGDKVNDLESKGVRWRLPYAARVVTRSLQGDDDGAWFELCTLPIQGMRSIISMVSISPEGFLPSILLLVVIIVTVVILVVTVILVVVVVAIIEVVIVVVSSIIKLSFVIIGSLLSIVLCYLIH